MRPMLLFVIVCLANCLLVGTSPAQAQQCARDEFQVVVGTASATLRDMTQRNTPAFQDKLRQLRDKRNWSYDQFVKEAAPFVTDDKIAEFDAKSADYLNQINEMSSGTAADSAPDCRLLDKLRANMTALVETQTEKWAYMFGRLDAELVK